jgi:ubiquinone/menaquinone biosynthesis C-methylase UbiE
MEQKAHWEHVFSTKTEKEVSWYQEYPKTSVDLIQQFGLPSDAKIIDVGGGDSYLMDALLDLGYTHLYVLDISAKAIERHKNRLGDKAKSKVTFIVSDVLDFHSDVHFDLWHDRACFHFLTDENQIKKYAELVSSVIKTNRNLVVGTFSESGPKKCSGLEITQYSANAMKVVFKENFDYIESKEVAHQTPFETIQNFIFCLFNRK